MKKMRKILSMCTALSLVASLGLTGCGATPASTGTDASASPAASASGAASASASATAATPDISKTVELSEYLLGAPGKDYDLMLTELNAKLKTDLNATVKVSWIGWGDFGTKYPLILASGEPVDLIYTATWLNFYSEAQKGAFKALEEIGPKYAPKSFAAEPKAGIQQATVNGHIYALPPNYTNYTTYGIIYRGDLLKKYNLQPIKTLDDYGLYLDAIVKNEKGMDPAGMYSTQTPIDGIYLYSKNMYPLAGDLAVPSPFWIDITDASGKVQNIADRADMPEFLAKMKDWSDKGYWPKSVLSNKDNTMLEQGKAASLIHNLDTWVGQHQKNPSWDLQYAMMIPNSYPLPMMQDGMAIPSSATNPERALMFLEKLRTDETYWQLMSYGIKGKHFEITADNLVKPLALEAFTPEQYCSWGFRDNTFRKDTFGSPPTLKDVRESIKSTATTNKFVTFTQNVEPVKNEYAAVLNVMQQYYIPMKLGYVDPVKGLAMLKDKLKAAGVEKVQAEFQKQMDEFMKNNP